MVKYSYDRTANWDDVVIGDPRKVFVESRVSKLEKAIHAFDQQLDSRGFSKNRAVNNAVDDLWRAFHVVKNALGA